MTPLGTRRQAEELARLLEGGVSGATGAAAPQLLLAMRLRAVGARLEEPAGSRFVPAADFRDRLRTRLVAVASVQAAAEVPFAEPVDRPKPLEAVVAWTQTRTAQRRIGVTAGAMAGIIAFTGVGLAASHSLPGQPFYPVKREAEALQLALASGDQAKGTKHLEFAATRLREVGALAHGDSELALGVPGQPQAGGRVLSDSLQRRINDTLADFNSETRSGRMLLEGVYRKTGKPAPLRLLTSFSADQQTTLKALLPDLPTANQVAAEQSLALVQDVQSTANQQLALGLCGGECFPGNAGPVLPTPAPSPGETASPSGGDNGVAPCYCGSAPGPEPTETAQPSDSPSPAPSASPTASPTPTPSSRPTSSPSPQPLPVPLPTDLPTVLPTIVPTALPSDEPSVLPGVPLTSVVTQLSSQTTPVVGKLP